MKLIQLVTHLEGTMRCNDTLINDRLIPDYHYSENESIRSLHLKYTVDTALLTVHFRSMTKPIHSVSVSITSSQCNGATQQGNHLDIHTKLSQARRNSPRNAQTLVEKLKNLLRVPQVETPKLTAELAGRRNGANNTVSQEYGPVGNKPGFIIDLPASELFATSDPASDPNRSTHTQSSSKHH